MEFCTKCKVVYIGNLGTRLRCDECSYKASIKNPGWLERQKKECDVTEQEKQELEALQEQCNDYERTLHDICELLHHENTGCCEATNKKAAQEKAFKALERHGVFA